MRMFARLLALFGVGVVVSAVVGAIVAKRVKEEFVPIDDPEANEIRLAAIFGPFSFKSTAPSFRGGTIDCRFGGGVIDLRGATLDPAGARLDVKAQFGGAQILVPESWRVATRVFGATWRYASVTTPATSSQSGVTSSRSPNQPR